MDVPSPLNSTRAAISNPPTFSILYFASASSYTTKVSEVLQIPVRGLPLSELFPTLESRYPGITVKVLSSCAVTINLEYADVPKEGHESTGEGKVTMIMPGDEVGIIPPVSAG